MIGGAATGGAALVVRPDGGIKSAADFRGKTIATPQLGNTQDISCRAWLKAQGYKVTQTGGDVKVLPVANADQLAAFLGLHARPAAEFVRKANTFRSEISLVAPAGSFSALSLLEVMRANLDRSATARLEAHGVDAEKAVTRLAAVVNQLRDDYD